MSYIGVRNLKKIQNEQGLWNCTCDAYDSSIRDSRGNRVWDKFETLYKSWYTKEDLDFQLFKDTLDGNIHGTGGSYACISWGNCKVTLPIEDAEVLKAYKQVKEDKRDALNKLQTLYRGTEDKNNIPELKKAWDESIKAYEDYNNKRYELYFKAWKSYLKKQRDNKKNGKYYVCRVSSKSFSDVYIKSIGKWTTKYAYNMCYGKVFNNIESILEHINKCKEEFNYHNIQIMDVTNIIATEKRKKYADHYACDKIIVEETNADYQLCTVKR